MFKRIFSNIKIERQLGNGKTSEIDVKCVIGNRSRIMKSLENADRKGMYKLPLIVITRTGYSRNGQRLANLHNEVKYEISREKRIYDLLTPIPIDISYDVSIIAKNPADIDMIASNFMVFFNSDVYVTSEHPKFIGLPLNNQVIMSDSVSEEHSDELGPEVDDIMTSTFQFTFKTNLFAGSNKFSGEYGLIPEVGEISVGFYAIPSDIEDYYAHMQEIDSYTPEDQPNYVDRYPVSPTFGTALSGSSLHWTI